MPELSISSTGELENAARALLSSASGTRNFVFYGDLGAGKTSLIKEICKLIGVKGTVSSPSFSIVNEYLSEAGSVYHFDFYRLRSEEEAYDLGCEEYFGSGKYCFIEWPDRIPNLLPEEFMSVHLTVLDENKRHMKFEQTCK